MYVRHTSTTVLLISRTNVYLLSRNTNACTNWMCRYKNSKDHHIQACLKQPHKVVHQPKQKKSEDISDQMQEKSDIRQSIVAYRIS